MALKPADVRPSVLSSQVWGDLPEVTTPLLKFMAEFVFNKSTRLTFDASSPNGILLFRRVPLAPLPLATRVLEASLLTTSGLSPSQPPQGGIQGAYDLRHSASTAHPGSQPL